MDKIREQVISEIIENINKKIKEGYTVKYRGKEVEELDIVEIKHGLSAFKRVYIKYTNGTINVLSFNDFLSRRVEVE